MKILITESQYKILNEQLYKLIDDLIKPSSKITKTTSKAVKSGTKLIDKFSPSMLDSLVKNEKMVDILDTYIELVNKGDKVKSNEIKKLITTKLVPEEYFDDLINKRKLIKDSNKDFVPGVWGDGNNNYSIDRLVTLVKDRKPTTMSIDEIIEKNKDLGTKEGNFKDNLENPTELFKKRTMKSNTDYPVMVSEEGWIIDGSHRIAKQKWEGIKNVKVHIISKQDLNKVKITNPEELKKSMDIKY